MISLVVATRKAELDNDQQDIRALLVCEFMLMGIAGVFAFFGQSLLATVLSLLAAIMLYPLLEYYRKWHAQLAQLLEATRNVAVRIESMGV